MLYKTIVVVVTVIVIFFVFLHVTWHSDLALQTFAIFKRFIKHSGAALTVLSLVGGGGQEQLIEKDLQAFNEHGGNIIVATPGRLNQFLARLPRCCRSFVCCFVFHACCLICDVCVAFSQLEVLVFDEADRLLDPVIK